MRGLDCGFQCYALAVFYFIIVIESVPPEYCLRPINTSDCHAKPTPVFAYYKPGSRCEIEMWRGCRTFNMFETEYECSHFCIFPMYARDEAPMPKLPMHPKTHECEAEFVKLKCTENSTRVYTHKNGACVEDNWYGCPTRNKFKDMTTCLEACLTNASKEWKQQLEQLPKVQVEEMHQILETIIENERLPMKHDHSNYTSIDKEPGYENNISKEYENVTDDPDRSVSNISKEYENVTDDPDRSVSKISKEYENVTDDPDRSVSKISKEYENVTDDPDGSVSEVLLTRKNVGKFNETSDELVRVD